MGLSKGQSVGTMTVNVHDPGIHRGFETDVVGPLHLSLVRDALELVVIVM